MVHSIKRVSRTRQTAPAIWQMCVRRHKGMQASRLHGPYLAGQAGKAALDRVVASLPAFSDSRTHAPNTLHTAQVCARPALQPLEVIVVSAASAPSFLVATRVRVSQPSFPVHDGVCHSHTTQQPGDAGSLLLLLVLQPEQLRGNAVASRERWTLTPWFRPQVLRDSCIQRRSRSCQVTSNGRQRDLQCLRYVRQQRWHRPDVHC